VRLRRYTPPPRPGSAPGNHPTAPRDPRRSAPDPNTPPRPVSGITTDARGRPRLPVQVPPRRLEEDYAKNLLRIVRRARAAWAPVRSALPGILADAEAARRGDRLDVDRSAKLRQLVAEAGAQMRAAFSNDEIEALARKFADHTQRYQKDQLARQVKAALGVDPIIKDRGLAARADHFAHENVALVQTIPTRLHGELESMVTRAVSSGRRHEALAEQIEDRFGVSESRARVIARDQVGKFYAATNHARQREMGVDRFVWRTVGDERVRGTPGGKYPDADPSHFELDGDEYDYDDPPNAGPYGEPALPGEAIQCRCYAEPVFDDLDEDDGEADDEDAGEDDLDEEG
jgi:SPP1 gp7 family putative phage head morphogenesis protein